MSDEGEERGSAFLSFILLSVHRVSLFDYQAMCKNSHHHANAARPLPNVSQAPPLARLSCVSASDSLFSCSPLSPW